MCLTSIGLSQRRRMCWSEQILLLRLLQGTRKRRLKRRQRWSRSRQERRRPSLLARQAKQRRALLYRQESDQKLRRKLALSLPALCLHPNARGGQVGAQERGLVHALPLAARRIWSALNTIAIR